MVKLPRDIWSNCQQATHAVVVHIEMEVTRQCPTRSVCLVTLPTDTWQSCQQATHAIAIDVEMEVTRQWPADSDEPPSAAKLCQYLDKDTVVDLPQS